MPRDARRPKLRAYLKAQRVSPGDSVTIDWWDLARYDPELGESMRERPLETCDIARASLSIHEAVEVGVQRAPDRPAIASLGLEHAGQLVGLEGAITRVGERHFVPRQAALTCPTCGERIFVDRDAPASPLTEISCGCGAGPLEFDADRSTYVATQALELAPPSPADDTPRVIVHCTGQSVGAVDLWERVTVTGVPREREDADDHCAAMALDALSIEGQLTPDLSTGDRPPMADIGDLDDRIVASVAPSIEDEKLRQAIALQLFGGVVKPREFDRIRGDIHILVVSSMERWPEPIIEDLSRVAPRLTHIAEVDDDLRSAVAAVDGGLAVVDDIHAIDRAGGQSILEEQRVQLEAPSATASARVGTLVLARARSDAMPLKNRLGVSERLLACFDVILERPDGIATTDPARPPIGPERLRRYVREARTHCQPLSHEAKSLLERSYLAIRQRGSQALPPTPLSLESASRLSEAAARMRFAPDVTAEDVRFALPVFRETRDVLSGFSTDDREILTDVLRCVETLAAEHDRGARGEAVYQWLVDRGHEPDRIESALSTLRDQGGIVCLEEDTYRSIWEPPVAEP